MEIKTNVLQAKQIKKIKNLKCPTCKKKAINNYAPFCSKKCSDIDLIKWLIDK
tara:strand:- start:125 stop:283 length:159 start_codon:yes stop_codon:yes gene_type:complete